MQMKVLGIVISLVIVVGVVVLILTRPSVAPSNTNTNQTLANTTTNQEPQRSFTTNANVAATPNTNQTTNTAVNTSAEPEQLTVTVTSAGLNPKSPTVSAGTTITFVNQDSVTHQITSKPHPVHTDLPGFDLVIAAGSSRSFTFTRVGSWGYHDHLSPFDSKFQGTVTVQ